MINTIFSFVLVCLFVSNIHSQTVNMQGNGKVSIKNGRIKTKGDIVIGDGDYSTKTISTSTINSIVLEGSGDIEIIQSNESKVEIDADKNILDLINVRVTGGVFKTNSKKSFVSNNQVRIRVFTNNIQSIDINGSGDVTGYELRGKNIKLHINGSGDIKLTGKANSLVVKINGSGDIDCINFKVLNADIKHNGSGDVNVFVTQKLKIYHDGSGDINYWGHPKVNVTNEGLAILLKIKTKMNTQS